MKDFISFLEKFKPNTGELPKKLGSWVERKYSEITKAIELWKTPTKAVKTVVKPKRLAFAVGAGAGTYKLIKWFESKSEVIAKFFENNPDKDSIFIGINLKLPTLKDKDILDTIRKDNPTLFPKNFKMNSFILKANKKGKKFITEYYLINNIKYVPVDINNNLKVKKIK
jgi:hypothetical protein